MIYVIWASVTDSATTATAPLSWPITNSPITRSVVFPDGPFKDVNVIFGADASEVSLDSKIPWILTTSALFNTIFLSWTLVPTGKFPETKPSFKDVAPTPEAALSE